MSALLPLDFPPLVAMAEAVAKEAHNLFALLSWGDGDGWDMLEDDAQLTLIRVHSELLANLDRPESRLRWVFWLQQQQAETPEGWALWDIVSDADSAEALRAAVLAVGATP